MRRRVTRPDSALTQASETLRRAKRAHVRTDTANHKSRAGEMNGWSSVQDTPAGLAARGSGGGIAASRAAAWRPA